jgi:hypothetical protein
VTRRKPDFTKEADLVAAFCRTLDRTYAEERPGRLKWVAYHETAKWDLLLVNPTTGIQVGVEAKLTLNPEVLLQAVPGRYDAGHVGPDYRAVLVPRRAEGWKLGALAHRLGLTVLSLHDHRYRPEGYERPADFDEWNIDPTLPTEDSWAPYAERWHSWLPGERCKLPDYVPDVMGGQPAPVALTEWKVKAIKLFILLDRRGVVTRGDMKALGLSPTRFCDPYNGFLAADPTKGGYVRHASSPDFRAQHPRNYAEIEADFRQWCPPGRLFEMSQ